MNTSNNKPTFIISIIRASILIGLFGIPSINAQEKTSTRAEKEVETITVTATRRATSIQETAISVEAFSGDDLAERGYSSIGQFVDTVPGVTAVPAGPTGTRITIRNVATSTQEGGSAVIATYLDDFALTGGNAIKLVDMERVEVLKGPQGTLYGRSAMGGIVRYISNKARTDTIEGGIDTYVASVTDGGNNYGGHAYLNLPLTDTLAVRVVGYSYQNSGFIDNTELGIDDFNDEDTNGGRIALHWDATEQFSLDLTYLNQSIEGAPNSVTTTRDHGDLNVVGDEGPDIPFDIEARTQNAGVLGENGLDHEILNLKLEHDFESFSATFLATNSQVKSKFVYDQREYVGMRTGCICQAPDESNLPTGSDTDILEFRLVSTADNQYNWIAGVYYEDGTNEWAENIHYSGPEQLALGFYPVAEGTQLVDQEGKVNNREKAIYGEVGYSFNEDTHLTVGYRRSNVAFDSVTTKATGPFDLLTGENFLVDIPFETEDDVSTYKIALEHSINDDLFTYATASSGYRRGGFNLPTAITAFSTYASDKLWNYEVGVKSTLLDGDLIANAALFLIDYTDIQLVVQDPETFVRATQNAGKAQILGLEFSLAYQVNDNFDMKFAGSISDPELKEDVPGGVSGKKGDRLPGSANHNFSLIANWYNELDGGWEFFSTGSYRYVGSRLNDFNTDLDVKLASYQLLDLRIGFSNYDDDYSVSLFADNVLDQAITYVIDRQGPVFESVATNRPRTIGIRFAYSF